MEKVEVRHIVRRFDKTLAVNDVSFTLSEGQVFGFVGPNGAGKTTTMRIMATMDDPDSGDVLLNGVSTVEYPEEARRQIGFMPDSLPAHTDITVDEYIDFFGRAYGLRRKALTGAKSAVVEFTQLGNLRDKTLAALSKGMKQRVSLARALIHDPDVLVLDEPAAGLDPRARIELRELVKALSDNGKTLLISSHILSELSELCDGIIIIEKGRILSGGTLEDVIAGTARGREMHQIELRALNPDDFVRERLLETPGVDSAVRDGEGWLIEFEGNDEVAAEMLRRFIAGGLRVTSFATRKTSLEDIFMKVTKGVVS